MTKQLDILTDSLGVSVESLERLNIGWDGKAYTFPMSNDFDNTSSLRQAIAEVLDELNSNPESDLTLRFRDPLSKNILKVA
ncbi:MAG: hypothetical protein ACETWQ_11370 [Phycisphaerae bacterium]